MNRNNHQVLWWHIIWNIKSFCIVIKWDTVSFSSNRCCTYPWRWWSHPHEWKTSPWSFSPKGFSLVCDRFCFLYGYSVSLGLFLYWCGTDWGTIEFHVLLQSRSRCTITVSIIWASAAAPPSDGIWAATPSQFERHKLPEEEAADVFLCWLTYFQLLFLRPRLLLPAVNALFSLFRWLYLSWQLLWIWLYVGSTILSPKSILCFISS